MSGEIALHYHIYCNQNNLEANYQDAIAEFTKRLSAYCDVTLHTGQELSFLSGGSPARQHFLCVVPGVSSYSSPEFAEYIDRLQQSRRSAIHITVGFPKAVVENALASFPECSFDTLSLTRLSLPPASLTLLLYEQLYRGYTILQGKTYHK